MIAYWLMLLIPVSAAFAGGGGVARPKREPWIFVAVVMILLVGQRFYVGGDWPNYQRHFITAARGLEWALEFGDPGYYVTSWWIAQVGGSIFWLNTFCAVLLVAGTFRFASRQPRPWLAVVVAVPYLLIVVGMGYTRQAAAIGLVMWGMVALREKRLVEFAVSVLLAALFHKTAILMLPIAALAATQRRVLTGVWVGALFIGGFQVLLEERVEDLYFNYVESVYAFESEGAAIRVSMNAVAAIIFLIFRERMATDIAERRLYGWMSLITLACIPLLSVSPTAVDRMALYLIPLQLVVFSRLPDIDKSGKSKGVLQLSVIGYYTLVQFVWLNYASHAFAWLPYRFAPFSGGW